MAALCVLATVFLVSGCSQNSGPELYYDLWWVTTDADFYNNDYLRDKGQGKYQSWLPSFLLTRVIRSQKILTL